MTEPTRPQPAVKFLLGSRVYLRLLEREDLGLLSRWVSDPVGRNLTGDRIPQSRTALESWHEKLAADPSRMRFVICLNEDNQTIGTAALTGIHAFTRSAVVDVHIGEVKHWGKGHAFESLLLLLDYAFGTLGLHRVGVEIYAFNQRAVHIFEKMGFQHEGTRRDGHYYDHRYHDVVLMGMLDDEFRRLHKPPAQS